MYSCEVALIKASNVLTGNSPLSSLTDLTNEVPQPPVSEDSLPNSVPPPIKNRKSLSKKGHDPTLPSLSQTNPPDSPPLTWEEITGKATAQLKAFLIPAKAEITDKAITLVYSDTHRFHFERISERVGELEQLVHSIAGPNYSINVSGPEKIRKKV